ncbi:OmpW family protein [Psychroserpens burtonensis]|uniref:OmpW family protein n=1 Tax=Psychroserpens burtonensis TaxID=49278 RepID=A0A5C7BE15_9FLAO|nr:OmpW family outer membrane protein [Psychroserpens burtonensis]TXE17479.1 OmpW family protein [Psychroserpens burtonensis]
MKKLIFGLLMTGLFSLTNVNAQDANTTDDTTYSKWQARFRVIAVVPSPEDDIDGANVDISTTLVPEVDFTYFFNKNLAAELILATTKHEVEIENGADLGYVWLLPPSLNLQYHFYADKFKPYVGAGINYTIFYGEDAGDIDDIDYDNAFGFSFQAGVDYNLNDKWFLNFDIKKLFLKTDVTLNNDSANKAEVEINPLLVGFGAGFKF